MNKPAEAMYVIPNRFRKMENLHIVFWLLKDISWCMSWKIFAVAMIIPTLFVAIVIAWRTRQFRSELAHNLAIAFWICANSTWMICEFIGFDTKPIWLGFEGKHLALIPFLIGLGILAWYYLIVRPKEVKEHHAVTM